MNNKIYLKRLEEGRVLVQTYENARFALGKYCVEMFEQFKGLRTAQLSKDLNLKYTTLRQVLAQYRKTIKLFKKDATSEHFLLIQKACSLYGMKQKEMSKSNLLILDKRIKSKNPPKTVKAISSFISNSNKAITYINENGITPEKRKELIIVTQKVLDVLKGKLRRVA